MPTQSTVHSDRKDQVLLANLRIAQDSKDKYNEEGIENLMAWRQQQGLLNRIYAKTYGSYSEEEENARHKAKQDDRKELQAKLQALKSQQVRSSSNNRRSFNGDNPASKPEAFSNNCHYETQDISTTARRHALGPQKGRKYHTDDEMKSLFLQRRPFEPQSRSTGESLGGSSGAQVSGLWGLPWEAESGESPSSVLSRETPDDITPYHHDLWQTHQRAYKGRENTSPFMKPLLQVKPDQLSKTGATDRSESSNHDTLPVESRGWSKTVRKAGKYAFGAATLGGALYLSQNPSVVTDHLDTKTLQSAYDSSVGAMGSMASSAASKFSSVAGSALSGVSHGLSSAGSYFNPALSQVSSWFSGSRDTAASQLSSGLKSDHGDSALSHMPSIAQIKPLARYLMLPAGWIAQEIMKKKIVDALTGRARQGKEAAGSVAEVSPSRSSGSNQSACYSQL